MVIGAFFGAFVFKRKEQDIVNKKSYFVAENNSHI